MSKWQTLIEKAETIKLDLEFVKSQIEGTTFGELCDNKDRIEAQLDELNDISQSLVAWTEGLNQAPSKEAQHRRK